MPTDWTATDAATIQRKGWSLKEETNFKNHQTRWKYHVREPWNPETNPPGVKEELWRPVISPNDYDIIEFPESMYSVLDAIGFTAWRFDGSLVDQSSPGKRDLYLELDGDFYCDSALFINPANQYYKKWQCAEDGFGNSYSGKIVNLGEIAQVLP